MALNQRTLRPGSGDFNPKSISGLALWLDGSDGQSLYTSNAGPVSPVSSPLNVPGCVGWWDGSDTSSMYTTDAGPVVPVNQPTDIAGCQLWLDASDASTITASGGEVTAWTDKSETGSSWTRVGGVNGPATGATTMGGKNVVVFDGTNDGLSAVTPLNTSMPLTFFVVQRVVSGTVAGMTYTAGTGDNFNFRQAADTSGTLEITAGGSRMQLGGALLSQNTLYSLTVPASSNASFYRDGTVVSITTNAALKPTLTGTHYLGRRVDGFYGNVQIAEIVAYSAELTATQRASVESYLATKWGISGVHRSAAQEIAAVTSPTDIGGCLCWYDAADSSSITKDENNLVSQWRDKTVNARHATASGALRPTSGGSQNGRTVMQFTGTQAMTITGNFLQRDNVTMFAVAMKNTDHYGGIISSAPTNPEDSPILCFYLTTIAWLNRRVLVQQATGNGVYRIVSGQSAGTSQQGFFDGLRGTDTTASVATNTANTITKIGALRTGSTADLNGNIAEIICYEGNLSDTDRLRVEKYLAAKWGTAAVPDPKPPVGYWADKSGQGINLVQPTSTARPTAAAIAAAVNGRSSLTFDGTDFLSAATTVALGDNTVIMVVREDVSASYAGLFSYHPATGSDNNNADGWVADLQLSDNIISLSSGAFATVWAGVTTLPLSVVTLRRQIAAGDRQMIRANGSTQAVNATASTGTAVGILIGGRFQSGVVDTLYRAKITLCEVLRWDRALSVAEYASVESYLATKWGIADVHKNSSELTSPVQSPAELPGLDSWWDFSDASTVTVNGNQEVTSVAAKVGTNATLTPSFAGFFASYGDYINGRKAIFFGEGEYRRQLKTGLGVADPNTPLTVFMSFAPERNASVPAGNQALISKGTSSDGRRFSLGYYPQTQGAPYTNAVRLIYFQAGTSYDSGSTASASASGCNIVVFSAQPGDVRLWADRTSTYSSTTASSYGTTESASGFSVGGNPEGGTTRGAIGEIIIFRRILSENERQRVEHYLRLKWRGDSDLQPTPPVGAWMDKSGKSLHAVQTTAEKRPLMGTQNGRKALTFDGVDDNLSHTPAAAIGATEVTHIAVLKNNLTNQPNLLYAPGLLTSGNIGRPLDRWQGLALTGAVFVAADPQVDVSSPFRSADYRFLFALDGKKDEVSTGTHQLREFINGASIYSVTSRGTWSTTGQKLNVGTRDDGGTRYKGDICELLLYDRKLSTAERQRAERYLASRWGIPLAPQVSNSDAQDWIQRVYANGGTVSESTAKAVSTFCDAIDAANIRDRFYRMGIFAGSNLSAALTPLYRTPNKTVTNLFQHGTDMSNAVWQPGGNGFVTRAISTEVGPLGYGYATKLTTPSSPFDIRQMHQYLPVQNRQVTLSVWLKTNTGTRQVQWIINGDYLDTFTVTSTWTRYTKTYTSTASASDGRTGLSTVSELSDAAGFILAWGMQCEYGATATDYTQPSYGNITDTNVGPFVASDYNETGAGGGLAAGSGKYLNTGLPQYVSPAAGSHLSVYEPTKPLTQSYGNRIGVRDTSTTDEHVLTNGVDTRVVYASGAAAGNGRTGTGSYGEIGAFWLGVSTSATSAVMYKNGLASGFTGTPASRTPSAKSYYVFALNSNNAVDSGMTSGKLASYSVGLGLSAAEALKYSEAMLAFQRALGRDRPMNDPAFAAVTNEDARLWIDTVYANGGTVSVSTANAVNTFCNAIEAANVRDRFYRLNLFCGGTNATTAGLNSCLTPLFKNWKSCSGRNLQKYGDVLTASTWTKSNSTASISASERPFPYGPFANVLTANAGTNLTPYVVTPADNFGYGTVTVSAYLKAAGVNSARILLSGSSGLVFTGSASVAFATVNLTTGAVSGLSSVDTATATSVGNGWWRFAVTATSINGPAGNIGIRIDLGNGNSFNPAGTESLLVWGIQSETGSVATAYDPYPLGNLVDANAGSPFIGTDYANTGPSGGLQGNGSNKCLRHGVLMTSFPDISSAHLSAYQITAGNGLSSLSAYWQHSTDSSQSRIWEIIGGGGYLGNTNSFSAPSGNRPAMITLSRESQNVAYGYLGSSQGALHATSGQSATAAETVVFARNLLTGSPPAAGFVPALHSSARLGGYSLGAGMTSSQVSAYANAMETFQSSLGRLRASSDPLFSSVTNEDAKLWIDNVYKNGGTVNVTTANAINTFCNAIDAANIRDRFYRLNLFCGGESGTAAGLNACLTPLYRGPSRTGQQYGSAIDNNIGGASAFVSADYAEASGLQALQGTTKYLDTGLTPAAMQQSVYDSMHLSVLHGPVQGNISDPMLIGSVDSTNLERYWIQLSIRTAAASYDSGRLGRATQALSLTPMIGARTPAFLLISRRDATSLRFFRNGAFDGEATASTTPLSANPYPFFVFRNSTNGTPNGDWGAGANIRSYSIGDDMSDIQVAAFHEAQKAFQYAIRRTI